MNRAALERRLAALMAKRSLTETERQELAQLRAALRAPAHTTAQTR